MPGYVFPTEKERLKLFSDLETLEEENGIEFSGNDLYKNYKDSIKSLDEMMRNLSGEDEDGLPIVIDEEKKDELIKAIQNTAKAGELFLAKMREEKKKLNEGIPGVVNKIQGMISKDYDTLSNYDVNSQLSLSEIVDQSRTLTVDLSGHTIKKIGNMQSSRLPMIIKNSQGKSRAGVFTKAKYNHVMGDISACFERAKASCNNAGKAQIDHIIEGYRFQLISKGREKISGDTISFKDSQDYIVGHMLKRLAKKAKKRDKNLSKSEIKTFLRDEAGIDTALISGDAITILTNGLNEMKSNIANEIENWGLELKDGDRIDNRNSCMSAVASLLGASGLIARSDNMKYKDENGNVVEGTFMDYGKGLDLNRDYSLFRHISTDPYKDPVKKGNLFKQIADLQVIDFLCNNVDRHVGNLMYQVDEEGNIIGIQGIDNDSSFGTAKPCEDDILCLKAISRSMWKKLDKMDPEMLKFSLRGKGLREEELDAAADRLKMLKDAVKYHKIIVFNENDIRKNSIEAFKAIKEEFIPGYGMKNRQLDNIFTNLDKFIKEGKKAARDAGLGFEAYQENNNQPSLEVVGATERKGTVGGVEDTLRKVYKYHSKKEDGLITYRGRSEEFFNLVQSVGRVLEQYRRLKDDNTIDKNLMLNDIEAKQALIKSHEVFSDLADKADKYLKEKMRKKGVTSIRNLVGKNTYEQMHIDYAKEMIKLSDEFFAHVEGPSNDAERQELTRNYERRQAEEIKQLKKKVKEIKNKSSKDSGIESKKDSKNNPKNNPESDSKKESQQDRTKKVIGKN